jgi:hypothetical protein
MTESSKVERIYAQTVLAKDRRDGVSDDTGMAALVIPGVIAPSTSEAGQLKAIRSVLIEYELKPILVSPKGVNLAWDRTDTGQKDFRVIAGNFVAHLNLRPNATKLLIVAYSGGGMVTTHCAFDPEIIPIDLPLFVAGFSAKFDDTKVYDKAGHAIDFKKFRGDSVQFCSRVTDIISIHGSRDFEVSKAKSHPACLPAASCIDVDADHASVFKNEAALDHLRRFLERIGLRASPSTSATT